MAEIRNSRRSSIASWESGVCVRVSRKCAVLTKTQVRFYSTVNSYNVLYLILKYATIIFDTAQRNSSRMAEMELEIKCNIMLKRKPVRFGAIREKALEKILQFR